MAITIHVPKPVTTQRLLASMDFGAKPAHRVRGGWMDDLTATGKMLLLCPLCKGNFNPKSCRYELWRRDYLAIGRCDSCQQMDPHCTAFTPEANHDAIGQPTRPRRRGRWASR